MEVDGIKLIHYHTYGDKRSKRRIRPFHRQNNTKVSLKDDIQILRHLREHLEKGRRRGYGSAQKQASHSAARAGTGSSARRLSGHKGRRRKRRRFLRLHPQCRGYRRKPISDVQPRQFQKASPQIEALTYNLRKACCRSPATIAIITLSDVTIPGHERPHRPSRCGVPEHSHSPQLRRSR